MNTEELFHVLSGLYPLSDEFRSALIKVLVPLTFPKNHLLLNAPAIAAHAYYLQSGFVMSYSFVDGKKITQGFWKSGQLFVSHKSFLEQIASRESLQLMEDSELLCISYESIQLLLMQHEEAHLIYQMLLNRHHDQCRERLLDMQRFNASERFERLLQQFPRIEEIIPQDAIASYLGVTPQSLSRIKRQINKP
jgi:CRP-like cAMP-binding protein